MAKVVGQRDLSEYLGQRFECESCHRFNEVEQKDLKPEEFREESSLYYAYLTVKCGYCRYENSVVVKQEVPIIEATLPPKKKRWLW